MSLSCVWGGVDIEQVTEVENSKLVEHLGFMLPLKISERKLAKHLVIGFNYRGMFLEIVYTPHGSLVGKCDD